jgi:hypothetical protein
MRMRLEVVRSGAGRLEGRLATEDGTTDTGFIGTLELLRLIEDLATEPEPRHALEPDEHRDRV